MGLLTIGKAREEASPNVKAIVFFINIIILIIFAYWIITL